MTPPTLVSQAISLTFDEVLRRLAQHDLVDGLIVIGSAATNALTTASDYDLYLVLSSMPALLLVGLTWIDGRITDLVFEQTATVDRFLTQAGSCGYTASLRHCRDACGLFPATGSSMAG